MKALAFTLATSVLLLGSHAEAALPPLYQSLAEFKSIINNPDIEEILVSGELITKIERDDHGYLITTNKHTLQAFIEFQPASKPGPQVFKVRFGEPKSL